MRCGVCGTDDALLVSGPSQWGVYHCMDHRERVLAMAVFDVRRCPHCDFAYSRDAAFLAYGSECPQCRHALDGDGPVRFTTAGPCIQCGGGPQWVRFDGTCASGGHRIARENRYTPRG